jgi:hypothetical protein
MSNGSSTADHRPPLPPFPRIRAVTASPVGHAALIVAIAGVITLLAWPIRYRPIITGLDSSWQQALHMAVVDGLRFGTDLVFTYGPLGFLAVPSPPVGWTSVLALLASGLTYLGLVLLILHGLRRFLPLWGAAIVALVAARMFANLPPYEALQVAVFIVVVNILLGSIRLPTAAIIVGGGLVAAVTMLGKLNVGVFVTAMAGVAAVSVVRPWPKGLLAYVAVMSVSVLGLWLLSGQNLGDVAPFIGNSIEIISGYSQAMGTDREPPRYHWIYAAYAIVAATLVWYALRATSDVPRARRFQVLVLLAILLFAMWKTAFTRGFPYYMFATAGIAVIPLLWSGGRQAAMATLAAIWIAYLAAAPAVTTSPTGVLDVPSSVRSALLLGRAALPWRIDTEAELTRHALRDIYELPADVLGSIGDRSLHIDPWEAGVAQAYPDLHWEPVPVFQSYSAYTTVLDELNADRLRRDDRPERILREFTPWTFLGVAPPPGIRTLAHTIDGRFYWFESPSATLERLCRYEELVAGDRWQVLGATARRCGEPTPLGTIDARAGAPVVVPTAPSEDDFVIVRVHGVEGGLVDRIRTALVESIEWYIQVDGRKFRLVPGTADQGLLLAVPQVAQGSEPFAFGPRIDSISVSAGKGGHESDDTLTYEFLAVPISPRPGSMDRLGRAH